MNKIKVFLWKKRQWLLTFLPDKLFIEYEYKKSTGQKLNLKNPMRFNEKIQWLKLYDRNPKYTKLVDKYEVRKYIEDKIGKEHLIPLIGVWNNVDDIDFNALPNQFVLKPTHTSGDIIICKDKNKLDIEQAKLEMKKWLKRNYYKVHREWPYKNVQPRIICEKYMVDESGTELKDYKFMCFKGEPKLILLCYNRKSKDNLNINFYDNNWNLLDLYRPKHPPSSIIFKKPKQFSKMMEYARVLSKDVPFLRVDFYEANEQLYFGELTFYPGSGYEKFVPDSYDYLLGSWIELPNERRYT